MGAAGRMYPIPVEEADPGRDHVAEAIRRAEMKEAAEVKRLSKAIDISTCQGITYGLKYRQLDRLTEQLANFVHMPTHQVGVERLLARVTAERTKLDDTFAELRAAHLSIVETYPT